MTNPPPPMPLLNMLVTPMQSAEAIAASVAVPPSLRTVGEQWDVVSGGRRPRGCLRMLTIHADLRANADFCSYTTRWTCAKIVGVAQTRLRRWQSSEVGRLFGLARAASSPATRSMQHDEGNDSSEQDGRHESPDSLDPSLRGALLDD